MLYLIVKKLKVVYKFDTEIHSAVEDWCINVLGLDYDDVYFYDQPTFKQTKWPEVFIEVGIKGGYIFTIKNVEITRFTKKWMTRWGEATLQEVYRFLKERSNSKVKAEIKWLIKKHGGSCPVRRLL